jgi:CRP/FNR family transcriptional regulator
MKLLAKDLDVAEITISSLAQKQVRERVAETLLMLKEFYGMEEDGKTIKSSMSRYDIASIAGTARETATRLLSEFKQDRVIDFDTKKILILNPQKLINIANLQD